MFHYNQGQLLVEDVPLCDISEQFGTPVYVYSKSKVLERFNLLAEALSSFEHRICYPVKCNFNLAILNLLKQNGTSFDVASEGELRRINCIGADNSKVVFTGVGKSRKEIEYALDVGIGCFHVESEQELQRIEDVAFTKGLQAPIALRINPNVITQTHNYIATGTSDTKFGIPVEKAEQLYIHADHSKYLQVKGIHCHIGSQITEPSPYIKARDTLLSLVDRLIEKAIKMEFLDIGGGFGVCYKEESSPPITMDWGNWLKELAIPVAARGLTFVLEPGRFIMAEAGLILTRVKYIKKMPEKNFVVVDAAMSDFIRPALYNGYHEILNVTENNEGDSEIYDVVGPLCESSDFLAKNRSLRVSQDDLLVVVATGAYGSVSSSNFSSRARAPEVMVDGSKVFLIKERESFESLMALEHNIPS